MDSIVSRVVLGVIRHGAGVFFAGWATKGWLTGDQAQTAIGAVMTLVPILFSVYDKMNTVKKEK